MTATIARPRPKLAHIEGLAAKLADARSQRKQWEAVEAELSKKLVEAHTAGVAATKFTTHGWNFSYQGGRKTVVYLSAVKAKIQKIQDDAKADGQYTVNVGEPSWKIVPAKEA
jgi:hypothetical protein